MSHRCWEFSELVGVIAATLVSDDARASAVALASCSKSLEESALAEVWRSLPCLAPLIKCFPPDVWEVKNEKLAFKRAPLQGEWTRFEQQYASKVRHLVVSSPDDVVFSDALHVFQLYSSCSPLLPNLISLVWDSDETFLPFVSLFITHSLMSIDITVPNEASPLLPPILSILSMSSPGLRDIQVTRLRHGPSLEEASSQLLMNCNPHLRIYNVDSPISASALRHVVQLPSLEEFWLLANSFQLPDPLPTRVFPRLQSLDVEFEGEPTWLKLLPAIEDPALKYIFIECSRSDVAHFMETFQLTMISCRMHERLQEFQLRSVDEFKITPQMIAFNFVFSSLTSLEIHTKCSSVCLTFELKDEDIDMLTNALGGLESLSIGEEPCGAPSEITFKSLYTISRRCTRLKNLQIHFNPVSFITEVDDSGAEGAAANFGLSNIETPSSGLCSVTEINVGSIVLLRRSNTHIIMALGLRAVFPCLEKIEYRERQWENVAKLIGLCRRVDYFASERGLGLRKPVM